MFRHYPGEEAPGEEAPGEEAQKLAEELAEEAAKSRQELFRDARNWPLPYLVTSAVYHILSTKAERIYIINGFWHYFLWLFLSFDKPLFDMLRVKDWGKIYRNEIREGFQDRLSFEIHGLTGNRLMWGSDKGKPWFTCQFFASHIYPEDVLRRLDLIGIDPGLAHLAVDQVFQLQSLIPLYDALSHEPSSMPAIERPRPKLLWVAGIEVKKKK